MSDDPRFQKLLDALLDPKATPEEVCADCPELLPAVRTRWRQMRRLGADLNRLFPSRLEQPLADPELPQVPGYEMRGVLGRGAMGIVFRARHLRLNRPVALKMILAGQFAVREELERFVQEAEAVAGLHHPNIVQVYDAGEFEGRPYFTMELVEGERLSQKIAGVPQPARESVTMVAALADAVSAAHQNGIIHRDLKPSNIMLAPDGTPRVTDFGLARRLDKDGSAASGDGSAMTMTNLPIGSPSYMAPEQARGEKGAMGPAVDVYALGAIIYELLTGRPPFRGETSAATIQQLLTQDAVPPSRLNSRVPRDVETICLKCLHKERSRRYASAAELADDLRRFLQGKPISARPVGKVERTALWLRRHPAVATAFAAAVVLAITLAITGAWWYGQRTAAALDAMVELRHAEQYRQQADHASAAAALDRAKRRLGGIGAPTLRATLDRESSSVELLRQLDEIHVERAIVAGTTGLENALLKPEKNEPKRGTVTRRTAPPGVRYERVFRTAGIGSPGDDPAQVAARVAASPVRESLVAALDDWAACAIDPGHQSWILSVLKIADPDPWRDRVRDPESWHKGDALQKLADEAPVSRQPPRTLVLLAARLRATGRDAQPLMTRVVLAYPTDFWANTEMGNAVYEKDPHEAMGYFRATSIIRPRLAIMHDAIAVMYQRQGRWREAIAYSEQAIQLDPGEASYHNNYAWSLAGSGRLDEAIAAAREALRANPNYGLGHDALSSFYARQRRHEEALEQARLFLRHARPEMVPFARSVLLARLLETDKDREAREVWRETLAANPSDHDAWFGYAELCLFLGDEDAYRRERTRLFKRFGESGDPVTCERIAKACLLLDGDPAELNSAAALADHAVAKEAQTEVGYPYALFVQGLAAYRLGRFDEAITIMNGKAASAAGPCPKLVTAMALYRKGETAKARELLSTAVSTSDWRRKVSVGEREPFWVAQILRREAESLIRPQPRANDSTSPASTARAKP